MCVCVCVYSACGYFSGEIVSAFIYLFIFTKISTLLLKKNVLGNVACIYRQMGFQ